MTLRIIIIYLVMIFSSSTLLGQKIDTLNRVDGSEKKQGYWIITGKDRPSATCYKPEQKIEEGNYINNRKIGLWMEYYCNGNLKNNLTYANGRPDGFAKIFYENGNIKEEGTWKINKWVDKYTLYKESGEIQYEFLFDSKGRDPNDTTKKITITDPIYTYPQKFKLMNGIDTLYNKNRQITKAGFFKDNRFMDGKAYIYDENGVLTRISIYKDGVYIGDTQISK